jgi:hypothetical protein
MSLGDLLEKKLDAAGTGRGRVEVETPSGATAEVDLVDADRLGATIDRVKVSVPNPGALPAQADHIAEKVRDLGDRLIPIEVDERLGGGRLRTDPGEIRGGRFYEVDLDGDSAGVERYQIGDDGQRTRQPYTLTREQLGRLVDDLADGLVSSDEGAAAKG